MKSKRERYREILAVLARHGIDVVDDELIKNEGSDRARGAPTPRVQGARNHVHQARPGPVDAR
jgi:hypothetical protein